jgi:hypothetical protein
VEEKKKVRDGDIRRELPREEESIDLENSEPIW